MSDSKKLSQQEWQIQENLIAQFEAEFQQGNSPRIEDFLTEEGIDRYSLLVELVHTDLEQRLNANESVQVEEYLERFPELGDSLISHLKSITQHNNPDRFHAETIIRSEDSTHSQVGNGSTPPPGNSSDQNQPFPQFDRYIVKQLLGAGAFGKVFLAHDSIIKRDVALKVPKWQMQPGSEDYERTLREARAIGAMRHPNICELFDILETDDRIVLVIPYFKGGSLAEQIKKQRCSIENAIQLTRILATAMASAHDAGVVHRDLKTCQHSDRQGTDHY